MPNTPDGIIKYMIGDKKSKHIFGDKKSKSKQKCPGCGKDVLNKYREYRGGGMYSVECPHCGESFEGEGSFNPY